MKDVAIIIPYYSNILSEAEKISLDQMIKVYSSRDMFLLTKESMTIGIELSEIFTIVKVADKWLQSKDTYNLLMLSTFFYEMFLDYRYILISQLDVFVIEDSLSFFMELNYDYYGAPWLYGYFDYLNLKRRVLYVGNGGYSLRRVRGILNVLEKSEGKTISMNEDVYFASKVNDGLKVAPIEIALQFAFEREVIRCYIANNRKMPSACHAWSRYNYEFIRNYLMQEKGIDINLDEYDNEDNRNLKKYEYYRKVAKLLEKDELYVNILDTIKTLLGNRCDNFVIWGNGLIGKNICQLLSDLGVFVSHIVDADKNKQGSVYEGIEVLSPESIISTSKVLIATDEKWYPEIKAKLIEKGMVENSDFVFWKTIIDVIEAV